MVVGGGEVATRKVHELLACEARVVIVSPELSDGLQKLFEGDQLVWRKKKYSTDDLDGASLVFVATNDHQTQQVVLEDTRTSGILVNSATDPKGSTFHVPARLRRGDFLLTVSTGGGSPALAAKIRKELETAYGMEYQLLVKLLAKIREQVVEDGESQRAHGLLFKKLLDLDILNLIRNEEWEVLRKDLEGILPPGVNAEEMLRSIQES